MAVFSWSVLEAEFNLVPTSSPEYAIMVLQKAKPSGGETFKFISVVNKRQLSVYNIFLFVVTVCMILFLLCNKHISIYQFVYILALD